ncbi:hypothetical protein RFI_02978, partial [Reticulomyxa filosa]
MLYYHVVGTEQSEDVFLLDARSCGDAKWFISPHVFDDGKWLLIFLSPNCDPVNRLYLIKLQDLDLKSFSFVNTNVIDWPMCYVFTRICCYLIIWKICQDALQLVDLTGKPVKYSIAFPSARTIVFTGRKTSNEGFFHFTSFLYPGIIYLYDFRHHSMKILFEIK